MALKATHMLERLVLADQTGHFVGLLAQLALVQELLLRGQPRLDLRWCYY